MADERYTFETARIRLEEIAVEVRKKDTSLEKSLDLLEEGVRLANICTELVDHTDLGSTVTSVAPETIPGAHAVEPEGEPSEDEAAAGIDDTPGDVGHVDELPIPTPVIDDVPDFDEMDDDLHEPGDAGDEG